MAEKKKRTSFNWRTRLAAQSDLMDLGERIRAKKKKIVFTAGNWDLLHVGQTRYLQKAKELGDVLVVGVASDIAVREKKGKNKPILGELIRAEMLANIRWVDFVTIFPETSCQPSLGLLKPDVFLTVVEDWNTDFENSKEYKTVTSYDGEVVKADRQSPFLSTTKILDRAIGGKLSDMFKDFMDYRKDPLREK
ncbi:MAG: adenylyltransferase/cytidyltransferase family protein [Candidatus Dojkabacteria bacterium]|nr:adenylyltransferase/cytidyltransferase family protein [Candidatus Dojkabacteria bacterium]MDQ7020975.1 adenylyltransferase/cytidyltransferase family protein [Candidatus Dojkabacteria bacterium]